VLWRAVIKVDYMVREPSPEIQFRHSGPQRRLANNSIWRSSWRRLGLPSSKNRWTTRL
jgi:hypothetical protein